MTWKDVFDGAKLNFSDFNQTMVFVKQTQYKFFAFNGRIYFTSTGEDTNLKVDILL